MSRRRTHQVELHKLIYTTNWEDPAADLAALKIRPGDAMMTITSGACNTLEFLLSDPSVVHTVDINPSQAYLIELKIAAMRRLEHPDFLRFLGLTPGGDRMDRYSELRSDLSPAAAAFWDARENLLRPGFLFRGRYDRFVDTVGRMTRLIQGRRRVDGLFEARDVAGQKAFYDRAWDIRRTRLIFLLFYNKRVLARIGLKADYFRFDDGSNSYSESFRRKFRHVVSDVPLSGNYFVHVYLKGGYRSLAEVPNYLKAENYATIRDRLDRIRIHTGDAKKWLAGFPDGTFDALALSNICELMSLDDTRVMFREVLRTAKPGARLSFRNLIIPREVPEELRSFIVKDEPLSGEMKAADRSFVYSRVAAYEVRK
jgi:S-adenosylmethionine-diacylglycerol 3-amino-3-carboxypropyl transferase